MKGLRKYLTPFAPDQSGAESVLYQLGGILVILDAGGCTGNICGFDEPRWSHTRSAVFSAGLRDMDAIMGRDELLGKKLEKVAAKIDAGFIAIIGTPVPSVIGTDYHALARMTSRKVKLPILTIDTDGMHTYEVGEQKAYLELMRQMVPPVKESTREDFVGVFGATPLDLPVPSDQELIKRTLRSRGYEQVLLYGADATLKDVAIASSVKENIVVAPSGLKAAQYMEKTYQVPFRVEYPGAGELLDKLLKEQNITEDWQGKKVLILHQQVLANELRKEIKERSGHTAKVTVCSYFMMHKEWMEETDRKLREEDDWVELLTKENYNIILADTTLSVMTPDFDGQWINLPSFAISGKYDPSM
jgi:hypothetical protein